ncbi:MAG: 50S ribosomal protein L10 [Desulfobacteraceae bacterium]|nr:MAG: 50S ribosomal protein L10 [Deltaproteobacteria bacterium]TET94859.1 MAG: 50S ribosomal protein L10 [Desulfobacteraceae bacterium]
MDRKEKEKIITGLKERLGKACGTFLVDYQGLNVDELTKLRRELRKKGIEFQVVKNRLLLIASQDTEADILRDYLAGPCALAITYDDVVTPAKVLTKFMQDYEALEIKIGQINGKLVELSAIKRLAQLPSKEVLLSQLLFSLSGVPISFVRLLSEMPRRLINVLEAIKRQKA